MYITIHYIFISLNQILICHYIIQKKIITFNKEIAQIITRNNAG